MADFLPEATERTERAVDGYVMLMFDEAVRHYRVTPSARNWVALKRAMLVLQAWWQRRRPAVVGREAYNEWLERLGCLPVGDEEIASEIFARGTGKKLADMDLFS